MNAIMNILLSLVKEFSIEMLVSQLVAGKKFRKDEKAEPAKVEAALKEAAKAEKADLKVLQPLIDMLSLGDEAWLLLQLLGLRAAKSKNDHNASATIEQIDNMAEWLQKATPELREKLRGIIRRLSLEDARTTLDQLATMSSASRNSYIAAVGINDPDLKERVWSSIKAWAEEPPTEELVSKVAQMEARERTPVRFGSKAYWRNIFHRKHPLTEVETTPEQRNNSSLRGKWLRLLVQWELRWWWERLKLIGWTWATLLGIYLFYVIFLAGASHQEFDYKLETIFYTAMFACAGLVALIMGTATYLADLAGEKIVQGLNALPIIEKLKNPLNTKAAARGLVYAMSVAGLAPTFITDTGTTGFGAFSVLSAAIVAGCLVYAFNTPGSWRRRLELGAVYYHCLRIPYWFITYGVFNGDRTWAGWWTRHWEKIVSTWDTFISFPGWLILAILVVIGLSVFWVWVKLWAPLTKLWVVILVLVLTFSFWGKWAGITPGQNTQSSSSKQVVAENWCTSPALSISPSGEFDFTATCPSPAAGGIVPAGKKITITKVSGAIKPKPDWDQVPGLEGLNHNTDASAAQWRAQLRYPDSNVWAVLAITSNGQVVSFVGDKAEITNPTGGDLKWSLYYNDEFRSPLTWQGHSGTIRFRVEIK